MKNAKCNKLQDSTVGGVCQRRRCQHHQEPFLASCCACCTAAPTKPKQAASSWWRHHHSSRRSRRSSAEEAAAGSSRREKKQQPQREAEKRLPSSTWISLRRGFLFLFLPHFVHPPLLLLLLLLLERQDEVFKVQSDDERGRCSPPSFSRLPLAWLLLLAAAPLLTTSQACMRMRVHPTTDERNGE